ncbi:MAG: response regulator [Desulfobacteraceae bacterium]|nr:response regulator [Desulfobacteraceae bacterium]
MNKTVLICDDEPYILESIRYLVKKEGYEVLTAEDGLTGLDLAISEMPDLLLLDVMMPNMSGYEVCRELKSDEKTRDIHIIMLTARGQERDREGGMEAGAYEYMIKPFSTRKLRNKIKELQG